MNLAVIYYFITGHMLTGDNDWCVYGRASVMCSYC